MAELGCHQIRIDEEEVRELDGERTVVRVPRAEVSRLRVAYGWVAERPLVQGTIGVVMVLVGLVFVALLVGGLTKGRGAGLLKTAGMGTMWVVAAPFVLRGALRRGYVLFVETKRTTRKLGFGKAATRAEVVGFAEEARAAGLTVRVEI